MCTPVPYAVKTVLKAEAPPNDAGQSRSAAAERCKTVQERGCCLMLRDITIGQHFPGNSVVHRCDPRLKLVPRSPISCAVCSLQPAGALRFVHPAAGGACTRWRRSRQDDRQKPEAHPAHRAVHGGAEPLLYHGEGDRWYTLAFEHLREGVSYAVLMAVRMALIAGTSLLTYTTSPSC